jgi:hypothetical protein
MGATHRLGKDQVAGGEVHLYIFFVEIKIDNAIALSGIKFGVLNFITEIRRRKGEGRAQARENNESRQEAEHLISLAAKSRAVRAFRTGVRNLVKVSSALSLTAAKIWLGPSLDHLQSY